MHPCAEGEVSWKSHFQLSQALIIVCCVGDGVHTAQLHNNRYHQYSVNGGIGENTCLGLGNVKWDEIVNSRGQYSGVRM